MDRKELIITTARKIIVQNGLFDSSIATIAKEAKIPVGSIYTYFKSKEELVNEIYILSKQEMGAFIFQPVSENLSEIEILKIYWERAVDFGIKNQEKFFFAEQLSNSPLINLASKEELKQNFEKVFQILENGIAKGIIKPIDIHLLHNIIYTNIVGTIKYFSQTENKISKNLKDQLFECCWDSIKL